MLLAEEDIERLERKGYRKEFFVHFDGKGYARLLNCQDHCVFYDVEKRRCNVYKQRPMGCRLYPIIYDETKGIVVDSICHAAVCVNEKKLEKKGKKVLSLLKTIDAEAEQRRSA